MQKPMNPISIRKAAILVALAAGLSACMGRSESAIGTAEHPLIVLLSPAHAPSGLGQSTDELKKKGERAPLWVLQSELTSQTGMQVILNIAASPLDAIEQLGTRKADAGILTLEEFLLAHEEYGVMPGLQVLRGKGQTQYDGMILVKAKSTVKKAMDLDGGKFGFVDPYSVSGFLLPAQYLQNEGVKVEARLLDSHDNAIEALIKGEVAAIATYGSRAAGSKGLRVLARTGTVPNEPFVFRKNLRPEKREALIKALKGLTDSPKGKQALLSVADITGFGPVDAGAYRAVHELLREAGKSVYDIVPEGAEVRRLNQPYMDAR